MIPIEPKRFNVPLGVNAEFNDIPDETPEVSGHVSFNKLFTLVNSTPLTAGGVAPRRTDFNALFKLLGDHSWWQQHGGQYPYRADYDYVQGNIVFHNNSLYMCLQNNGVTYDNVVEPSTNDEVWAYIAGAGKKSSGIVTGGIIPFAGSVLPEDYLLCNGAEISRTTFKDLFEVIGTIYGEGDGSSTFNLPDLSDRFIQGANGNLGTQLDAGMPEIDGYVDGHQNLGSAAGAVWIGNHTSAPQSGLGGGNHSWWFKASRCSKVYGASKTVQPPALCLYYLIKI